jgi:hypothetical protein
MILITPSPGLLAYRCFTASFPPDDFASATSPTLILGGHAIVYIKSVRAAVKVTSLALSETGASEPASPQETSVFDFDSDGSADGIDADALRDQHPRKIKITFRFVSTVEWFNVGDRVLVVPTASAAGPVSGPTAPTSGLSGFVGVVTDAFV